LHTIWIFFTKDLLLKLYEYLDDFHRNGNKSTISQKYFFSPNKLSTDFREGGHKFASLKKLKRYFHFNPDIKPQRTPACRNFPGKSIGPKQVVHAYG
jgi:hypothetical protein